MIKFNFKTEDGEVFPLECIVLPPVGYIIHHKNKDYVVMNGVLDFDSGYVTVTGVKVGKKIIKPGLAGS